LAHVFYNTTIIIRVVGSAWAQLDHRMEQAARVLGASRLQTFFEITVPLLAPAFLASTLLVFLFDFTSFGVILLLGGPHFTTLEVQIYIQALEMLNLPLAGLLSLIQLACTLIFTVIYTRIGKNVKVPLSPRVASEWVKSPSTLAERVFVGFMLAVLVILFVSPLAALSFRSVLRLEAERTQLGPIQSGITLNYYQELFINRRQSLFFVPPWQALKNSFLYAGTTVIISLLMGFAATEAMLKRMRGIWLLDAALMLPLGASAVTLGLGFVVVFSRPPLDVRSFPLLIPIAHSLVALPFVVRTLLPALQSIPESLRQAAAVLGASPLRVWLSVDLPIALRAAIVAAIFSFTISLGEFGATSFLAQPDAPTIPVAIYRFLSQPGALNYGQALAMATLLLIVCGLAVTAMDQLDRVQEHQK
jgi:thiamine transport system permease protein